MVMTKRSALRYKLTVLQYGHVKVSLAGLAKRCCASLALDLLLIPLPLRPDCSVIVYYGGVHNLRRIVYE
jgi:hypothetical protein